MDSRENIRLQLLAERVMRESAGPHGHDRTGGYRFDPLVLPYGRTKRKRRRRHCAIPMARSAVWIVVDLGPTDRDWWDDCLPEEIPPVDWDVPF